MRLVVTQRNSGAVYTADRAGEPPRTDSYRERLLKYIPAEALVFFVAVYGSTYSIIGMQSYYFLIARWILLAGIAVTILWLWKVEGVTDPVQLVISTVGFIAWIFAFGVIPITELPWFNQVVSALFLPLYVFGSPFIGGIPDRW
ncbi:MAG: hypothetical protein GX651_04660 [Methanomicrobiales archaeon]|nr:hypothetical protein [Methanomicrobiales archaeon]